MQTTRDHYHPGKKEYGKGPVQIRANTQKKSRINVILTTKDTDETSLQDRGASMVEESERLLTPVTIEFNLTNESVNFNIIKAVGEVFEKMNRHENSIRILENGTKKLLWEQTIELEEGEAFVDSFRMRDQTFRNGNKKVTLYCTIESFNTINKLKYMEPLNSHIMGQNIWIKPDFYSTKIVSSPGFFISLHPKITNKQMYTKELSEIIGQMEIDPLEEVVNDWYTMKQHTVQNKQAMVPNFHLETSIRKWGGLKTEVVRVLCAMEDAKYVKYLLAEAGSQGQIKKGTFVPTGIHLMEGKDVMTSLLREQQAFIENVTSFQISGISYSDMKIASKEKGSIQQLLLSCDGVFAVEPTFQTEQRGSWILVVSKDKIREVTKFIEINLAQIYARKQLSCKLMSMTQNTKNVGYKLLTVEKTTNKVGTYAEVLRRRYPTDSINATRGENSSPSDTEGRKSRGNAIFGHTASQVINGTVPNARK